MAATPEYAVRGTVNTPSGDWTETLISALDVEARASGPLISADDLATLDEMTPAELAEELTMHDQTARDNDSDRAYRAEIVTRLRRRLI